MNWHASKAFADSLVATPLAAGMASEPRPGIPAQDGIDFVIHER